MIEDLRDGAHLAPIETDVCVVGAGPAGLSIARALAGSRHRVCVLAGGGLECERDSQDLLEGASIGLPGLHPAHSRLHVFGGSCRLWGGGCIPLAPGDFRARPWVPGSGWPIGYADVEPWYRRALAFCGLGDMAFAGGTFLDTRQRRALRLERGELVDRVFALSPLEFGGTWLPLLASARNVRVLLHANALELQPDEGADRIASLRVGGLQGQRTTVRARCFVLAAGGIENARLLLLSDARLPGGPGNAHGLVGRYFQDHPRCRLGTLRRGGLDRVMRDYGRRPGMRHTELCLSEAAQRDLRLLACRVRPFPVHAPPTPGVQALRELRACLSPAPLSSEAGTAGRAGRRIEQAVEGMLNRGLPPPVPAPARPQLRPARSALAAARHAGDSVRGLARQLRTRTPLVRERIDVMGYFEQAPNPDSRIRLSPEHDALGRRRVCIDWRLTALDRDTHRAAARVFGTGLARACGGEFVPDAWVDEAGGQAEVHGTAHHIGTTRMADDPREGVVDADCRVHGMDNLYVAGSSVFPTGGWAFPTFTIVALGLRLAEHLRNRLDAIEPLLWL